MSAISAASLNAYPLLNGLSSTGPTQQTLGAADPSSLTYSQQISGSGRSKQSKNTALFQQIQESVTNALQGVQNNQAQGGAAADPNQIIQDAIAKIIQQNGSGSSDSDSDSDSDGSTSAASSDPQQAFLQALQQNGVNPQQFNSDFLSAIQQAQNGQADPTTAFSNFPTGSFVDTLG